MGRGSRMTAVEITPSEAPAANAAPGLAANGAGKTTTLKAISNLLHSERGEVTKGSIVFDGQEVQALSPNELVRRGCIRGRGARLCSAPPTIEKILWTGASPPRDGAAAIRRDLEKV